MAASRGDAVEAVRRHPAVVRREAWRLRVGAVSAGAVWICIGGIPGRTNSILSAAAVFIGCRRVHRLPSCPVNAKDFLRKWPAWAYN
ncbi:hypothetical protein ABZU25_31870 [Micromonospora sp. NPDC005215]|uniref:hypothetical protein n=1 Tax=Micromonospora sp. NPDC005215 TaxID=3157024 RepID=UPI0033A253ED